MGDDLVLLILVRHPERSGTLVDLMLEARLVVQALYSPLLDDHGQYHHQALLGASFS